MRTSEGGFWIFGFWVCGGRRTAMEWLLFEALDLVVASAAIALALAIELGVVGVVVVDGGAQVVAVAARLLALEAARGTRPHGAPRSRGDRRGERRGQRERRARGRLREHREARARRRGCVRGDGCEERLGDCVELRAGHCEFRSLRVRVRVRVWVRVRVRVRVGCRNCAR